MKRLFILVLILSTFDATAQVWKQYLDSAKIYTGQSLPEIAISFYYKAETELQRDSAGTISYAAVCDSLGVLLLDRAEYEMARNFFLKSAQIRGDLGQKWSIDYARTLNNLSGVYYYWGEYGKAESLYLETKKIIEKVVGKDHRSFAATCNNLALLYIKTAQYEESITLFKEAMRIQEQTNGKFHPEYAALCNNLALAYSSQGNYGMAESLYVESRMVAEKITGKNQLEYATACANLANLWVSMGLYEKAFSLYLESKSIIENLLGKDHPITVSTNENLGNLYLALGQFEKAEPFFLEGLAIKERIYGKENLEYSFTLENNGVFYWRKGEKEKALSILLGAKKILDKSLGRLHPAYARLCLYLGLLYVEMSEFENSIVMLVEAKSIYEKLFGKSHQDYAAVCNALALVDWQLGKPAEAEENLTEALTANKSRISKIFQFTSENEKAQFTKNILGEDDRAYSFYLNQKLQSHLPYEISLFHRNLVLNATRSLRRQLFGSTDLTISALFKEWQDIKRRLSFLYSQPFNDRKQEVSQLEELAGDLEKELTRLSPIFKSSQAKQDITWKSIQDKLQTDEVAIEFVSFQYSDGVMWTDATIYAALVLRSNNQFPELIPLFEKKQLDSLFQHKSSSGNAMRLKSLYTKRQGNSERTLYDLIWKPLEPFLEDIHTVYFAPSGSLYKIAFAALPINKMETLSDRYKLIQLNTTASILEPPTDATPANGNIILYGGIQYDIDTANLQPGNQSYTGGLDNELLKKYPNSFNYLPGSASEVLTISDLARNSNYKVEVLTGANATEESFKSLGGFNSPTWLHIATHGFFFPDPATKKPAAGISLPVFMASDHPLIRSGLAFLGANEGWKGRSSINTEDGILTAYEVADMYLPNTKLAVLSGCETGLGDIKGSEGVYGLQRAFRMAGVENLVMSLWKVPDQETAEFMQSFYKNLFLKQTISVAFNNAQSMLKKKYRDDPYKWAAWILVR